MEVFTKKISCNHHLTIFLLWSVLGFYMTRVTVVPEYLLCEINSNIKAHNCIMKFLKWQQSWNPFSYTFILLCCHFNYTALLVWVFWCVCVLLFLFFFFPFSFNHANTCKRTCRIWHQIWCLEQVGIFFFFFCHGAFYKWIKSLNCNQIIAGAT